MALRNKIAIIIAIFGAVFIMDFIVQALATSSEMNLTLSKISSNIIYTSFFSYVLLKRDYRFYWYLLATFLSGYLITKLEIVLPTLKTTVSIITIPFLMVVIVIEVIIIGYLVYLLFQHKPVD